MMSPASLANKTVLITRAKSQSLEMAKAVQKRGGNPVVIPLLKIIPVPHAIDNQMLLEYDWILFTSKNSVIHFFQLVNVQKLPPSIRIAAIGKKTKQSLEQLGCTVHFVPSSFEAEMFVKEFLPCVTQGERLLFPKGNLARDVIPQAMYEAGVSLQEIIVYETRYNQEAKVPLQEVLENNKIDSITFTSPSTVTSFVTLLEGTNWRQWVKRCTIGCIGPTTEREARKYFTSLFVPYEYTIEALLECVAVGMRSKG